MRQLLNFVFVSCFMPAIAMANTDVPIDLQNHLNQALSTDNALIIQATKEKLGGIFPQYRQQIREYQLTTAMPVADSLSIDKNSNDNITPNTVQTTEPLNIIAPPAAGDEYKKLWSGSAEGGLSIASGNTEEQDINAKLSFVYDPEHWRNTLDLSLRNEKDDGNRTAEEYRAENQLDYKLNDHSYLFGEAAYVDDRFSGFDYRISEGLGYGYYFIKNDTLKLNGELSGGARHTRLTTGDRENELTTKASEELEWIINDRLSFDQSASAEFGEKLTVLKGYAGLKADIYQSLFLKFGFEVENLSDVPAGVDKTDTLTTLNFGYDF